MLCLKSTSHLLTASCPEKFRNNGHDNNINNEFIIRDDKNVNGGGN